MARKASLGRNLNALLSQTKVTLKKQAESEDRIQALPVEFLHSGRYQPRDYMNEASLQELAESIKQQGIIQPIIVRKVKDKAYEIIAGERRWRAAQLAQLATIPAIVREISDEAALPIALIENIQREDLNVLEEARALARLVNEFSLTHEQAATVVGKSRTTLTNLLRLLNLDEKVQQWLAQGKLEMGHARALLAVEGIKQLSCARVIVEKQLSVREAEALIRKQKVKQVKSSARFKRDPNIQGLQNELSETLAAKVKIQHHDNGKGKLIVHYTSVDELEGILERIKS